MDAAFPARPFPSCTNAELEVAIAAGSQKADAMRAELDRRAKVAAGDVSVMTVGERLRHIRNGGTV